MSPELYALVAAVLVQVLAIALAGMVMNRQLGFAANAGPRDSMPAFSPLLGRLRRAVNNGFEGLALFTPAALLIGLTGQSTPVTVTAAWIYVLARILYVPAYAFPRGRLRSLIWGIGLTATLVLLVSALL